ncbi:MAG: hypothetical protein JWN68_1661 [Nocardioides sp.]|nr:hypothetical protein [Nocardioides sp.]
MVDACDGPLVAVGHVEVAIVASGRDPVTDGELVTGVDRDRRSFLAVVCGQASLVADDGVEGVDLFAGVGDDEVAGGGGGQVGDGCLAFDVAGVDEDVAAFEELVEHGAGLGPVRILRVRSA